MVLFSRPTCGFLVREVLFSTFLYFAHAYDRARAARSYYYVKSYAEGSGVIHLAAGIV